MSSIEKRKSFKAGFTKTALIELSILTLLCISIILFGLKSINRPENIWYADIKAGYIIITLGLGSIIFLICNYTKELKQYIVINPKGIIYQKGDLYFSEEWDTVKLIAGKKNNNFFLLKSTDSTITVKRKYFPKFDIILTILNMGLEP